MTLNPLFLYSPGSRPNSHRPKSAIHTTVVEEAVDNPGSPRDPTPVPEQTIFMQTMDFLLEVKATTVNITRGNKTCFSCAVLYKFAMDLQFC